VRIQTIRVSNFKTFAGLDLSLNAFDVLIGENGAGKSNFIDIIQFIRDIGLVGLEDAVSLQGDVEFVRNICEDTTAPFSLEITVNQESHPLVLSFCEDRSRRIEAAVERCVYRLVLDIGQDTFSILEESLDARCRYTTVGGDGSSEPVDTGAITLTRKKDGYCTLEITPPEKMARIVWMPVVPHQVPPRASLLEEPYANPLAAPLVHHLCQFFSKIAVYDFDPRLSKQVGPWAGRARLETDASNLPIVLRHILRDPMRKEELQWMISENLPFIEDVRMERLSGSSLTTTLKETYCSRRFTPASLLSDGTISLIALIVALYFEEGSIIVLEEPLRNIHPHHASKIIAMMKDASERQGRQLLITTHSPEIVKYAGIERILLLQRDERGNSSIVRPREKEELKVFLENMGVEELYVQNLL
jgi:predicted ATPase